MVCSCNYLTSDKHFARLFHNFQKKWSDLITKLIVAYETERNPKVYPWLFTLYYT